MLFNQLNLRANLIGLLISSEFRFAYLNNFFQSFNLLLNGLHFVYVLFDDANAIWWDIIYRNFITTNNLFLNQKNARKWKWFVCVFNESAYDCCYICQMCLFIVAECECRIKFRLNSIFRVNQCCVNCVSKWIFSRIMTNNLKRHGNKRFWLKIEECQIRFSAGTQKKIVFDKVGDILNWTFPLRLWCIQILPYTRVGPLNSIS